MKWFVRIIGLSIWAIAVLLTIALVREFTADQNIVVTGVAGLAILLSAFGLLFARYSWQRSAYPEVALGIAMWLAGFVCLTFVETSFWVNSYETRYQSYAQIKKAKQRQDQRGDQAWNALLTGAVPATSAQISAQIQAKELDPAVSRSKNCTDVTRADTRKTCGELFSLRAQLAKAKAREQLETQIQVEPQTAHEKISANVFAIAELLARWRGGKIEDWAYFVMLWNWLLLALVRDGGLLVANPLGRRREAPGEAKSTVKEDLTVRKPRMPYEPSLNLSDHQRPSKIIKGLQEAVAIVRGEKEPASVTHVTLPDDDGTSKSQAPIPIRSDLLRKPAGDENTAYLDTKSWEALQRMLAESPEPNPALEKLLKTAAPWENPVPPTDGGTPKSKTPGQQNILDFPPTKSERREQKRQSKPPKENLHGKVGRVKDWLNETTTQVEGAETLSGPAWENYQMWCELKGYKPLPRRPFTRKVKAIMNLPKKLGGPTKQQVFPILMTDPSQWRQRRIA